MRVKWADTDASKPLADYRMLINKEDTGQRDAEPAKPESARNVGDPSWSEWHQFLDKELFDIFSECKNQRHKAARWNPPPPPPSPPPLLKTESAPLSPALRKSELPAPGEEKASRKKRKFSPTPVADWDRMTGFLSGRRLPDSCIAEPPYFYFEHQPSQDWQTVSGLFYGLDPEPVDALHFSACSQPRAYIHNLPVEGRKPLPNPPAMSIKRLFPDACWPAWDPRHKLRPQPGPNRADVERVVREAEACVRNREGARDSEVAAARESVVADMRRLGMVWAGGKVRQLSVTELEVLLGYKPGHTTDGSGSRAGSLGPHTEAERFKWLRTAPSIHVLAFHFSTLKPLYPGGLAVLSLCSGLGGPAVALHRIGVRIRVFVSLDTEPKIRNLLEAWWERSKQPGTLVQEVHDVRGLTRAKIGGLIARFGKFDLVVCGSLCKTISETGQRGEVVGPAPPLLYELNRILRDVRDLGR